MTKHPIFDEVPHGYSACEVQGKDLMHLVRCEPFNHTALCGVWCAMEGFESFHGTPRPVCRKCAKLLPSDAPTKPDKPEPAGRTTNTPFRLTDEDKRRLDAIREHFAYWDRVDALRHAVDALYAQVEGKPPEEKTPTKYVRPT